VNGSRFYNIRLSSSIMQVRSKEGRKQASKEALDRKVWRGRIKEGNANTQ
jgi:hypothetical protein